MARGTCVAIVHKRKCCVCIKLYYAIMLIYTQKTIGRLCYFKIFHTNSLQYMCVYIFDIGCRRKSKKKIAIEAEQLKRRCGQRFTDYQLQELMKCFEQNQYIKGKAKKSLAEKLKLKEICVSYWFFRQRRKKQEELNELEQQSIGKRSCMEYSSKLSALTRSARMNVCYVRVHNEMKQLQHDVCLVFSYGGEIVHANFN